MGWIVTIAGPLSALSICYRLPLFDGRILLYLLKGHSDYMSPSFVITGHRNLSFHCPCCGSRDQGESELGPRSSPDFSPSLFSTLLPPFPLLLGSRRRAISPQCPSLQRPLLIVLSFDEILALTLDDLLRRVAHFKRYHTWLREAKFRYLYSLW